MTPDPYQASATSPSDPTTPQSWNRYAYTHGDPVNRLDPSGLEDEAICDADGNVCGDDFVDLAGINQGWWPCNSGGVMTFADGVQMPSPCNFIPVFFAPPTSKPAPSVPAGFMFLGATLDAPYTSGSCGASQPAGLFVDETFEVLDQYGKPFAVGGLTVQEKFGATTTTPSGKFSDFPYGSCSSVLGLQDSFSQQYRVQFNGQWHTLPWIYQSWVLGYHSLTNTNQFYSFTVTR